MRATVRTLNENGQHALTTARRACPARRPSLPAACYSRRAESLTLGQKVRLLLSFAVAGTVMATHLAEGSPSAALRRPFLQPSKHVALARRVRA